MDTYFYVLLLSMLHPHLSAIMRQTVALQTASGYTFFPIADILYFRANDKQAIVVMKESLAKPNGETKQYNVFRTLKDLETALSAAGFLRIRRDILLNSMNIKSVSKEHAIVLCTGEVVYPSRERIKAVDIYLKRFFYI